MPARKEQRVNAERSLEGSRQRRRKVGRWRLKSEQALCETVPLKSVLTT